LTTRDEHALRVEHVSKTFPGSRALHDVSFGVVRGEIHALLGGNGSGKSTLLRILAGIYHADAGATVVVDGERIAGDRTTPKWARAAGLRFVHQELGVFPSLSIAENVAIVDGFETGRAGAIDRRRLRRRTRVLLEQFEISAEPDDLAHTLSPADRTMLAIGRALRVDEARRVFVLDEPTVSLPLPKAQLVYRELRQRADAGHTVLFVSHRLEEIVTTADRATVLRDGQVAGTLRREELDEAGLIDLIVGHSVPHEHARAPRDRDDAVVLEARDLAGAAVHGVSFGVRRGEVLGIAGPLGAGTSELLQLLFGARPVRGGELALDGTPVHFAGIGDAMRAGIAYVPNDREDAAFLDLSLRENLMAADVGVHWEQLRLQRRRETHDVRQLMTVFSIRAASPDQEMATLSGGNQQKAILARWLRRSPRVLLLDEPTRGVDVGARAELHALVADAVAGGAAAVVTSNDFEELSTIADRVLVLIRGRLVSELRQPDISAPRLAELAYSTPSPAA
jgi:ribose transport system ATP-binding protein